METSSPRAGGARRLRESSVDTGALYERTKRAFVAVVSSLPDDSLQVRVPATPLWSVRDVVAHVVGLAADLNAQRFPAAGDGDGQRWTDRQVAERRDTKFTAVLDEWDRETPAFAEGLRTFGYETGSHFVADLHAHYHDVRGALALPRNADELVVRVALDHYLDFVDRMLADAAWGTLEVVAGAEARLLGAHGPHYARLCAQPFEVLRSVSGRRSARQIRALDWDGERDKFLVLLQKSLTGSYSLPRAGLIE
jgi:mycothiol maleylpyruvate isomerase-like protein